MPAWRNPDNSLAAAPSDADVPEGAVILTAEEFAAEIHARTMAVSHPE